jgi:hypothetical protein
VTTLGTKRSGFEYPDVGEYRHLPMSGPVTEANLRLRQQ